MTRAPSWIIVVFVIALTTRLLWIGVPLNIDEGLWMHRGAAFLQAVLEGKPAETYQRHHPGVTNMWVVGGAIASRYLLRSLTPPDDLARQSQHLAGYLAAVTDMSVMPLSFYTQARILAALITAACMVGMYVLSRRLFGSAVALLTVTILLFEPFFLGYQRLLTTDANQANFTWLALLAFLLFLREVAERPQGARLRWSLLSGVLFGLALLSKVSAALSLPAFGLAVVWWAWKSPPRGQDSAPPTARDSAPPTARDSAPPTARDSARSRATRPRLLWGVLLWTAAAVATALLLWPALRADLPGTIIRLARDVGDEIDGHVQFFLGQTVESPSLAFYPIVLIFRLSPLLLLGTLVGLISLIVPSLRRHLPDRDSLTIVLFELVIFLIAISSLASKIDRYIVPLVPGLALLTASGISAVLSQLGEVRSRGGPAERPGFGPEKRAIFDEPEKSRVPLAGRDRSAGVSGPMLGIAALGVLLIQLAVLLPHVPYYVTYYNPLVGGPARAQKLLMVGNGELLDRAAERIAQEAPARDALVASWYTGSFVPYYRGPTAELNEVPRGERPAWTYAKYIVLYINMLQRKLLPEVTEYFGTQPPLYAARMHDVDYVRVYAGPSVREVDLAKVPHRVNLDFGDNARLLGYDLQTSEVPAGEAGALALYWQALQPFTAPDFGVRLALVDSSGNAISTLYSAPVRGMVPVDRWQPGEILRDVQRFPVPPGTPPGDYQLEVSFWSPTLQRALEIRDGGALRDERIPLATIRVTQFAPG